MGPIKTNIGPYREQWSKSNSPIWISKNATVELSNNLKSQATPLPFFPHIDINWNPSHKPDSVLNIRFGYHRDIEREIRNGGVVLLKEKKKGVEDREMKEETWRVCSTWERRSEDWWGKRVLLFAMVMGSFTCNFLLIQDLDFDFHEWKVSMMFWATVRLRIDNIDFFILKNWNYCMYPQDIFKC